MLRNTIFSKLFFWLPLLFLFIYCVDIYFTVPNADDYDFFLWVERYGFCGFQKHMYLHQNGRFVASFFIACYSTLFNLIHIYWIFPLCFFILFNVSFFLFIKVFFKYLEIRISVLENGAYAAWLSLLFILVCKELSSFLFWMPGVINYQLVVTFFILGITGLLKYQISKSSTTLLLSLICFALCSGLHELFFLLSMPALLFYLIINVKNTRERNTVLLTILAVLIPFLISYFSSGTSLRQAHTSTINRGILSIIFNALLRLVFLFGYLLTVPYLYIVLVIGYTGFNYLNSSRLSSFFKKVKLKYLILGLVLQPMFIFMITIKNFSSGLPERAENLLLIQASAFLLLIAIKLGLESNVQLSLNLSFLFAILFALLFFLCISSQNIINGFKGMISGYIYKEISQSRFKNLRSYNGTKNLYLTNYHDELDSFYIKKYNSKMPLKLLKIAELNNIILFSDVYDLLEGQTNSFRHYNDIDTLKTASRISFSDTLIYLPVSKNGFH